MQQAALLLLLLLLNPSLQVCCCCAHAAYSAPALLLPALPSLLLLLLLQPQGCVRYHELGPPLLLLPPLHLVMTAAATLQCGLLMQRQRGAQGASCQHRACAPGRLGNSCNSSSSNIIIISSNNIISSSNISSSSRMAAATEGAMDEGYIRLTLTAAAAATPASAARFLLLTIEATCMLLLLLFLLPASPFLCLEAAQWLQLAALLAEAVQSTRYALHVERLSLQYKQYKCSTKAVQRHFRGSITAVQPRQIEVQSTGMPYTCSE
jgi:hypothetical protein